MAAAASISLAAAARTGMVVAAGTGMVVAASTTVAAIRVLRRAATSPVTGAFF